MTGAGTRCTRRRLVALRVDSKLDLRLGRCGRFRFAALIVETIRGCARSACRLRRLPLLLVLLGLVGEATSRVVLLDEVLGHRTVRSVPVI